MGGILRLKVELDRICQYSTVSSEETWTLPHHGRSGCYLVYLV